MNRDPSDLDALVKLVAERAREVNTSNITYSVRELTTMYLDGDIDVQPEFQRVYRWSDQQKSALIESMLLGIPVPSIFVAQKEDHTWDVVDGVQRLSTIISFKEAALKPSRNSMEEGGEGEGAERGNTGLEPFKLSKMEYLEELNGFGWSDLPRPLQRAIDQSPLEIIQIGSASSTDAKYNLFLRLNSGSMLSSQELRNCMLVMLNRDMFKAMKKLSSSADFSALAQVSKKKKSESFLDELTLRYFMQLDFNGDSSSLKIDFGEALTNWAKLSASEGNRLDEDAIRNFGEVMALVREVGGDSALRRYDRDTGGRRGTFSNAAFEFVMSGVGANLSYWKSNKTLLCEKLQDFWFEPRYAGKVGSGVNARDRFPYLVNFGRQYFSAP